MTVFYEIRKISNMSKGNPCKAILCGRAHLKGYFTDADIDAKHNELSATQEEKHKQEVEELQLKICELEDVTAEDDTRQTEELQKLSVQIEQAEGKIQAAQEQYSNCIADVRDQYVEEREGYCDELENLKSALKSDQKEQKAKTEELAKLEEEKAQGDSKTVREKERLRSQIDSVQEQLVKVQKDHELKKKEFLDTGSEKTRAYTDDRVRLRSEIADMRAEAEKVEKEFRLQEMELLRQRQAIAFQQQEDRKEMEMRFGPLLLEKEDMERRIKDLEGKVERRKTDEQKKCAEIAKHYDAVFTDRALDFERERTDVDRQLEEKEHELLTKEADLIRVREAHDNKINEINERIDARGKEMEKQLLAQNEQHTRQLEEVTNQARHQIFEDEIHNKRCELLNIESEQQAEEALLFAQLRNITDKEKNLREALNHRHMKQSDFMSDLDNELSTARSRLTIEQRQHEDLKEKLEQEAANTRSYLQAEIKDFIDRINDLTEEICNVQRKIANNEELVKKDCEAIARRADNDARRLGNLKGDLEEEIPPLQDKHNEVKQRIKEDKARHDAYVKTLKAEQASIEKEHNEEIARLHALHDNARKDQAKELANLIATLNKLQASNDDLQAKHEKEMYSLNLKLIQALEGKSDKSGAHNKLRELKKLQEEHSKKRSEYENLKVEDFKEKYMPPEADEEERRLQSCVYRSKRELLKDGVPNPQERNEHLEKLVQKKNSSLKTSDGDKPSHALEEAKSKNEELRSQIISKKKDLQELRSRRQKEISDLSGHIFESKMSKMDGKVDYNYQHGVINCVLDDLSSGTNETEEGSDVYTEVASTSDPSFGQAH